MNLRSYILLHMLLFAAVCVQAQSVISGQVSDQTDKTPIGGVVIALLDAEGETVAYSVSKQDGSFSVTLKNSNSKLTLHARLLGYEEQKREVENKTQTIFIEMAFGEIVLREVVVKSRPVWNKEDTLVYSVDAFKSAGDKTISDVLKKLPGVEVNESGGIKYQGEAINKFYIEGLDLLEKRYGIATNNLPVDAVMNVEVIENHQPLHALKNRIPSSHAAINLRLKKDKMERPVGTVTLGTGYAGQWTWLAEAFALSAGKKQQSIVMYKGNNAAKDIGVELTIQSLPTENFQDQPDYTPQTLLQPRSFNYPPLEKKRYFFNNSHAVSINSLWKTAENSQLRLNIHYLHEAQKEDMERNSQYLMPEGALHINETSKLLYRTNRVDAALTFTRNNPRYYLNNTLLWTGSQDMTISEVAINSIKVFQQFNMPWQQIRNDLRYVKRNGARVWDIASFSAYSSQPQRLSINVDTVDNEQMQQVNLSGFYTRNSSSYNVGRGNSNFTLKGAVEASIDQYRAQLQHPVFVDSVHTNISADYFLFEFTPSYIYRDERLTINAEVSLKNHYLHAAQLAEAAKNRRFFFVAPALKANYRFSAMLTARMGYHYTRSIGNFLDLTDIYFMSSYRSFSKYNGILSLTNRQLFNAGVQYRNPLTTFFFNSSVVYAPSVKNILGTQHFVGNESVSGGVESLNRSNMWLWNIYVGKYFSEIRTNTSLSVSYNSMSGKRRQQGVMYPFRASGWSFMPKLNIKLSDASSLSYQLVVGKRITNILHENDAFRSSMWQATQQLSVFYLSGTKWQFNGRLEHSFNEITNNKSVKLFFADIGIAYKHAHIEVALSANNLFNQRYYSYSIYNGLDEINYTYNLRPRMLMLSIGFRY